MSLENWLLGLSPKPGTKRKADAEFEAPSPKRKFTKELTQNSFDWYVLDEAGLWHCSVCREAKNDSAYAKGHENPAKTTNHSRHASSQSHLNAIQHTKNKQQKPLQKMVVNKVTSDDNMILVYLKCAYHLGKRELPKDEFSHLIGLADSLGIKTALDSDVTYTSGQSVSEFQSAIASVILEEKLKEIHQSELYSLMLDESTDMGNTKRLLLYAQYFSDKGINCGLLSNIQIKEASADAETIVTKVLTELENKGLKLKNLVGLGTDGASVMTGKRNGVVVKMKEHSPALVGVHCATHRCALAASQAAKQVPEIEDYSRTVSNIFHFFSASALRSNKLREIQTLLDLPELKYAEVHSVRWLSLENAVQVIYRTYPALCVALSYEGIRNPVAKGLYSEVSQYKFIGITHLLMDILPFLGRLSKIFQSSSVDYSEIHPTVQSTIESLTDLVECEGVFVDKLHQFVTKTEETVSYKRPAKESSTRLVKSSVQENVKLDGFFSDDDGDDDDDSVSNVELKYYSGQKQMLDRISATYIGKIVDNLENRFQDSELIQSMQVLVPANIVENSASLAKYGEQEMRNLLEQFGDQHNIDSDQCLSEYRQYKRLVVGSYSEMSMSEITVKISEKYSGTMPNVAKVLKCCVLIPITSVQCERGFSTQNRIKNKFRTRMNNNTLNDLMRISEDGPSIEDFNFQRALELWKTEKARKIYQQ